VQEARYFTTAYLEHFKEFMDHILLKNENDVDQEIIAIPIYLIDYFKIIY